MWALLAVFVVILCYDQLMFRPLLHIVRGYQSDEEDQLHRSWIVEFAVENPLVQVGMVRLQNVFSGVVGLCCSVLPRCAAGFPA